MIISLLGEILYTGVLLEKGRVDVIFWKLQYRKMFMDHIRFWKILACQMQKQERDMNFMKNLELLCYRYDFSNRYSKYLNFDFNIQTDLFNVCISCEQKAIIYIINDLIVKLEKIVETAGFFVKRSSKESIYYTLHMMHNLIRALFVQDKLINQSFQMISCEDAIEFSNDKETNEVKKKYQYYLTGE